MEDMIVKIILGVITIISALVSYYVIPVLKTKVKFENFAMFNSFIEEAVRSANQLYTLEEWETKKKYVVELAKDYMNANTGLDFTEEQINAIIEGVVREVKMDEGRLYDNKNVIGNNNCVN